MRHVVHHLAFVLPIALLIASLGFRFAGSSAADHLLLAGLAGIAVTLTGRLVIWIVSPSRFAMWRASLDANIAFYFGLGAMLDGKVALACASAGALLALLGGFFTFPPHAQSA